MESYWGFMAPAGIPRDVAAKIEGDIQKVLATPEVKTRLSGAGLDMFPGSGEQMLSLVRSDIQKFKLAIEAGGIKPE